MQTFYDHLKKQQYRDSTSTGHVNSVKLIEQWAQAHGMENADQLRYTDLMAYIAAEKAKGLDIATINNRIGSLRKYYEYLNAEGTREDNPAKRIKVKGKLKKAFIPIPYTELEQLYKNYLQHQKQTPMREAGHQFPRQRNLVMLGLMIWQGLQSGELEKIELKDLDLNAGTIYIPETYRAAGRELNLDPKQVIPLYSYIEMLKKKHGEKTERLFMCARPHDSASLLVDELKGIYPALRNPEHIRGSVIVYWLKAHGKRTAQYMAGHRHISSTEKYEQQDIETLIDQLAKHHPFG